MGEGRGGEGGGPGRVGSGRVESGRAVVQRDEARGTHDNGEQRTDRAKSWPNPDLYRKCPALPHSVQFPTVEKFSGVSTTPPLARFARCERLKTRNIREETTQSGFRMFIRNEINFSLV